MSFGTQQQYQPYAEKGSGPRASFWQRLGAIFIDFVILGIVTGILSALLKTAGELIGIVIEIGYFVYFEGGPTGQTIGKSALGIRVISLADGQPIGYSRAFIRWVGRIASGIVILLGYFWMLWDPESQCWHDKFAGSVVVPVSAYPPAG